LSAPSLPPPPSPLHAPEAVPRALRDPGVEITDLVTRVAASRPGLVAAIAAGLLVLVVLVIALRRGPAKPVAVQPAPPPPVAAAPPSPEPPKPPAAVAAAAAAAAAEPVAEPAKPAEPRPRHTLGGKNVVLEYDPKPTSPAPPPAQAPTPMGEDSRTVSRAREAYHKGNIKLFSGDSQGAIELYRESLKIYPGYVAGYRGLGLGFEAAGRPDDALKAFHIYVRTVPNANDVPLINKRIDRLEGQKH
jgi:tetratricopeptide (TPR) repeat protein